MSLTEKLKKDFKNNFEAHFKRWPRFSLAIYSLFGLICAFAAGLHFSLRTNIWLFDLAGALMFWFIIFWGTKLLQPFYYYRATLGYPHPRPSRIPLYKLLSPQ